MIAKLAHFHASKSCILALWYPPPFNILTMHCCSRQTVRLIPRCISDLNPQMRCASRSRGREREQVDDSSTDSSTSLACSALIWNTLTSASRFFTFPHFSMDSEFYRTRDTKSQNFPDGRISCAKTFRQSALIIFTKKMRHVDKTGLQHRCAKVRKSPSHTCHVCHGIHDGKLFTLSGNFPDYLETFQTYWKLSRLSRNFPDCPETF